MTSVRQTKAQRLEDRFISELLRVHDLPLQIARRPNNESFDYRAWGLKPPRGWEGNYHLHIVESDEVSTTARVGKEGRKLVFWLNGEPVPYDTVDESAFRVSEYLDDLRDSYGPPE